MRLKIDVELDYDIDGATDMLLLVQAAAMADQHLDYDDLRVSSNEPLRGMPGADGVGVRCWALAENRFHATYQAVVTIERDDVALASLGETAPRLLPPEAVPYLMPSRYCESDQFHGFLEQTFAGLRGGALAAALAEWVGDHLTYATGSSTGATTALMTFANRQGVCRDYAHLLVALARAGGIPARCVSAYGPGVEPSDFHAVAELWLDGAWRLVDATGMGSARDLVRIAVGRDATDIAFMTTFGAAMLNQQQIVVTCLDE
ncbi:transglutaminase family protein [Sphingomonas sp. H39-1-10]|uniref:transglutaminase-like domain-containing protein n=1 Tax=Sphingomonas TaxID=13687 RepID=UPI00088AA7A1|nr:MULTISPECIES: transglutaminase family protein [Sphingomonas]MDF0490896.1 transglutaminase family protein [Sphingomonas pollutisoli]SDA21430.1 Transglutaminase-like enzyme, putative cysteine protease [Sphingomonas sp. NFR15]